MPVLNKMVRIGLIEKVRSKHRIAASEGISHAYVWGKRACFRSGEQPVHTA